MRLLGSVEIVPNVRPVSGRRRKAVLAALALHPGRVVSADVLVEIVWADAAPATAAGTLQSHVSYLRRAFGDSSAIVARSMGYAIELGDDETDVQTAQRLVEECATTGEPSQRLARLQAAVALWRGPALADLGGLPWFEDQARRLDLLLVHAQRALAENRLAVGQHDHAVPVLESLCRDHPLDERLHELLMLALYRARRQVEALAVYRSLRCRLDEELGVRPGPAMRRLEAAILRQDTDLDGPLATPVPMAGPAPGSGAAQATLPREERVDESRRPASNPAANQSATADTPAQLPAMIGDFTGREREVVTLDDLLPGGSDSAPSIMVVAGMAGVGKTALAVRWAHRVRDRFPDGQLYTDLAAFSTEPAATPLRVLGEFLSALGVSSQGDSCGVGRGQRVVPQPPRRQAGARRTRQRGRPRPGPSTAAGRPGLPCARHQPQRAGRSGRPGRRPPAGAGRAHRRRGRRSAPTTRRSG